MPHSDYVYVNCEYTTHQNRCYGLYYDTQNQSRTQQPIQNKSNSSYISNYTQLNLHHNSFTPEHFHTRSHLNQNSLTPELTNTRTHLQQNFCTRSFTPELIYTRSLPILHESSEQQPPWISCSSCISRLEQLHCIEY